MMFGRWGIGRMMAKRDRGGGYDIAKEMVEGRVRYITGSCYIDFFGVQVYCML